jgi:hypothetical protein
VALPPGVATLLSDRFGAVDGGVRTPESAFSSSVAGVVDTAAGSVFVKASPSGSWMAADYAVEATVLRALPAAAGAPAVLDLLDDGRWRVLCVTVVEGRRPAQPWSGPVAGRVVAAYERRSLLLDPAPSGCAGLRSVADLIGGTPRFRVWRDLVAGRVRSVTTADLDPWCRAHLRRLADLEGRWAGATAGAALVHFDPRADNILVHGDDVRLVDWSRACLGAPWVDLATLAPAMQADGHDLTGALSHGPVLSGVSPWRVDAYLAALAGYWLDVGTAAPDAASNASSDAALRDFQRRSARGALALLRHRLDA